MPWMEMRHDLDGGEARILVESWYLDGGETVHGCRWDKNLGSYM